MAENTEYIFEKDFWGNWKLVPKKVDGRSGLVLLIFLFLFLLILFITLPLWISLLGFKMVKTKRYYAGIFSLLALIYFIIDVQNHWITGILFSGYLNGKGEFIAGMITQAFGKDLIIFIYILNGIGTIIGLVFVIQSYLLKNEKKIDSNFSTQNFIVTDNTQSGIVTDNISSQQKNISKIKNLLIKVLGAFVVVVVIYFSFNNKTNSPVQRDLLFNRDSIIGKTIIIGNLEIAENDFPNQMDWDNATIACTSLGKGWRLPNKDELNVLYQNKEITNTYVQMNYWSSSKNYFFYAWKQWFYNGEQNYERRNMKYRVRAIRNL